MTLKVEERAGAVDLLVRASPRARGDGVKGVVGEQLAVAVTAPPEDGRANEAVLEVIARFLGVRRNAVELVSGASSRMKRVRVAGLSAAEVVSRIERGLAALGARP